MSLKRVKEEIAALRNDIERQSNPEWITIKVPAGSADEVISDWLANTLGDGWQRHVIVRLDDAMATRCEVVERARTGEIYGLPGIAFTADEAALI